MLQVIYSYSDEGGIAKMLANHLGTTPGGGWVLPVWREMGGQQACNMHPELHGAAGVLHSSNQARLLLPVGVWPFKQVNISRCMTSPVVQPCHRHQHSLPAGMQGISVQASRLLVCSVCFTVRFVHCWTGGVLDSVQCEPG